VTLSSRYAIRSSLIHLSSRFTNFPSHFAKIVVHRFSNKFFDYSTGLIAIMSFKASDGTIFNTRDEYRAYEFETNYTFRNL